MPVTAKTKDWGDKFAHLSKHIGRVSSAIVSHNKALADEAGTHQHAFGRHGWQTGWEAQIVRAVSGVTPDSAADPYGLNPSLRNWGMVTSDGSPQFGLGNRGQRVKIGSGIVHTPQPNHVAPAKGASAGQFLSPMAQKTALRVTKGLLNNKYGKYVKGYRKKGNTTTLYDVSRLVIVTGAPYMLGLGFNFDKTKSPRSEVETTYLINAFQTGKTIFQVMNGCTFSSSTTRSETLTALQAIHGVNSEQALIGIKKKVAMPQMSDLCSLVGVKIEAYKRVLSVWDRQPNYKFKLVTMYATDDNRECGEYSLVGSNGPNGKATGRLMRSPTQGITGSYVQGKVVI